MRTGHRTYGQCTRLPIVFLFNVCQLPSVSCPIILIDIVAPRLGLTVNQEALASVTRGLVGDTSFAVLPEVTKEHTFILTLLFQLVRPVYTCSTFRLCLT